jgi:hypothetical protein
VEENVGEEEGVVVVVVGFEDVPGGEEELEGSVLVGEVLVGGGTVVVPVGVGVLLGLADVDVDVDGGGGSTDVVEVSVGVAVLVVVVEFSCRFASCKMELARAAFSSCTA